MFLILLCYINTRTKVVLLCWCIMVNRIFHWLQLFKRTTARKKIFPVGMIQVGYVNFNLSGQISTYILIFFKVSQVLSALRKMQNFSEIIPSNPQKQILKNPGKYLRNYYLLVRFESWFLLISLPLLSRMFSEINLLLKNNSTL